MRTSVYPVAGKDYPLAPSVDGVWFPDEAACRTYVVRVAVSLMDLNALAALIYRQIIERKHNI